MMFSYGMFPWNNDVISYNVSHYDVYNINIILF